MPKAKAKAKKKAKKPTDWSKTQTSGINWRQIMEDHPELIPPGYEETIAAMKADHYARINMVD